MGKKSTKKSCQSKAFWGQARDKTGEEHKTSLPPPVMWQVTRQVTRQPSTAPWASNPDAALTPSEIPSRSEGGVGLDLSLAAPPLQLEKGIKHIAGHRRASYVCCYTPETSWVVEITTLIRDLFVPYLLFWFNHHLWYTCYAPVSESGTFYMYNPNKFGSPCGSRTSKLKQFTIIAVLILYLSIFKGIWIINCSIASFLPYCVFELTLYIFMIFLYGAFKNLYWICYNIASGLWGFCFMFLCVCLFVFSFLAMRYVGS